MTMQILAALALALVMGWGQVSGAPANARSAILKAQETQASMPAYKVEYRANDLPNGETLTSTLTFVSPDRYHSVDHEGPATEVIRIGKSSWVKFGPRAFERETFDSLGILTRFRGPTLINDPRYELKDARALGPAMVLGRETLTYEYTMSGRGETSRVRLWVARDTGLPVRATDEFTNEVVKQRISWDIEYDATLTVTPPSLSAEGATLDALWVLFDECRTLANSELHAKPRAEFEQGMATLDRCVDAQPKDPAGFVVLARLFWDKAYRDWSLEDDEKLAYVERGLRCTGRALALKKDLFEAMANRGLLLRVKAKAVSDEALQKRLVAEADALRDQVTKLRSAGALPHPGLVPGQWPQPPSR